MDDLNFPWHSNSRWKIRVSRVSIWRRPGFELHYISESISRIYGLGFPGPLMGNWAIIGFPGLQSQDEWSKLKHKDKPYIITKEKGHKYVEEIPLNMFESLHPKINLILIMPLSSWSFFCTYVWEMSDWKLKRQVWSHQKSTLAYNCLVCIHL
jgi:hypothetical protein